MFWPLKMLVALYLLLFPALGSWSQPIPVKTKHTIIVDTDCAFDDLRAISLLLSRPEITVQAILLTDGSLTPDDGYDKIRALLHHFKSDTVPVSKGSILKGIDPPWRQFNKQINWGTSSFKQLKESDAVDLLERMLREANEKVILVCLGPLTNIARLIREDALVLNKIERVIWYNESIKPFQGFNYECNKPAADSVFNSGIRIDVISNLQKEDAIIDTSFYTVCRRAKGELAHIFSGVFSQPAVYKKLTEHHFRLCDDLVAVYITNPELFDVSTDMKNLKIRYNQDYNTFAVKEAMDDMIRGTYVSSRSIVFNKFPRNREMFTYDVRQIMDSAITKYGPDEWKANVMTDEFHGHLGVFSIVGAKMGIKAREIFGVGPDQLEVISFAGTRPPYSCLNDGLQVSTGATLGMGTIRLANDSVRNPSAIFMYKNHAVQLTLKPEYLKKVNEDINEGVVKFGLMDDGYWKLIRRNALKYWIEWDRNEIFDSKEIKDTL